MGLFTKYCEICGKKIEKGNDVVRFGKHFDSEGHAEQYAKQLEERRESTADQPMHRGSGGCGGC